jgi:beta-glucanase (GH16 family)
MASLRRLRPANCSVSNNARGSWALRRIDVKLPAFAAFIFVAICEQGSQLEPIASASDFSEEWVLSWSDEFNGPDSALDPAKWVTDIGGHGWGNNEPQYYTSRRQNVRQEDGNLVIEAIRDKFTGPDGVERNHTSGRLKTAGKFSQQYGRFEARVNIPSGQGIWPAFWLLGDGFSTKGWPSYGEIDIMEGVGSTPWKVSGSIHGPGYSAGKSITSSYSLSKGLFSEQFHLFAIEWEPQAIRFYVDDHLHAAGHPPISRLPAHGYMTTHFSSSSIWRWAATCREARAIRQSFRNACWWTVSECILGG